MKKTKLNCMWMLCELCSHNIPTKDIDIHKQNCPQDKFIQIPNSVKDKILYGTIGVKSGENIKGLSARDLDNFIFLSQSVIQLCELSIGSWAVIHHNEESQVLSLARIVWPTTEKSLTSVLFTQTGLDIANLKPDSQITVQRINRPLRLARKVSVIILNGPKGLEITRELRNRLNKSHMDYVLTVGNRLGVFYFGKSLIFRIQHIDGDVTEPIPNRDLAEDLNDLTIEDNPFFKVVDNTNWSIYNSESDFLSKNTPKQSNIQPVGGLEMEMSELKNMIQAALHPKKNSVVFTPCRGVILYGASGTGKTLLANSVAQESNATVISISATDMYGSEASDNRPDLILKSQFEMAAKSEPSIVIFDEIDALFPSKRSNDSEKRLLATFLQFFDDINGPYGRTFVLATSSKVDVIDGSLRRTGRFDRELEIPVPNPSGRVSILKCLLQKVCYELSDEEITEIAGMAHGFVGSDLVALVSRAVMHANGLRRNKLTKDDFSYAFTRVSPSAMREVQIEVPNVRWSEIGGQDRLKLILRQAVEWPLKHAESFRRMGIAAPRGVLMYGPPGCSKTMIARALATESGLNFLAIQGPELFSKWVGESERAVREVFRKARQVAPSIIFFDEIDALGGERAASGAASSTSVQERVLAQLLTELDGVTALGDVTVVAATNRPDRIDRALLRPGRLDRIVYVPLPDAHTRREILRIKFDKMPIDNVDLETIVQCTDKYSGAEINAVCHEAGLAALEEDIDANYVTFKHFEKALTFITPRTSQSLLDIYEHYQKS